MRNMAGTVLWNDLEILLQLLLTNTKTFVPLLWVILTCAVPETKRMCWIESAAQHLNCYRGPLLGGQAHTTLLRRIPTNTSQVLHQNTWKKLLENLFRTRICPLQFNRSNFRHHRRVLANLASFFRRKLKTMDRLKNSCATVNSVSKTAQRTKKV